MIELTRQRDFLVAIDSDGCVFDTMELKHKECFIPCFVEAYELQAVSKFARETWEFVNLYSQSRGVNRFPALVETLRWLAKRPEPPSRGVQVRLPDSLANWCRTETRLTNGTLEEAAKSTGDADLAHALKWSKQVNAAIAAMVRGVAPFAFVRESLRCLAERADLIVCSATPTEALKAEWAEHGLDQHVRAIFGQEVGSKKEILRLASQYPAGRTLMVGDAPGDRAAAVANGALFQPIVPAKEDASWREFFETGAARFFEEKFAGEHESALNAAFQQALPAAPSFRTG